MGFSIKPQAPNVEKSHLRVYPSLGGAITLETDLMRKQLINFGSIYSTKGDGLVLGEPESGDLSGVRPIIVQKAGHYKMSAHVRVTGGKTDSGIYLSLRRIPVSGDTFSTYPDIGIVNNNGAVTIGIHDITLFCNVGDKIYARINGGTAEGSYGANTATFLYVQEL